MGIVTIKNEGALQNGMTLTHRRVLIFTEMDVSALRALLDLTLCVYSSAVMWILLTYIPTNQ